MDFVIPDMTFPSIPVRGAAGGAQFPVRRIYCVGRNYVAHAVEMGFTGREPPFFFLKPGDAALPVREGEVGRMRYPTLTSDLHHEVELVAAIGKAFDESAPIGELRPAAECRIDENTEIRLDVNGALRQRSTLGKLIWSLPEIIEHLASAWTLAPGDLIFTGTPEGVAAVSRGDRLTATVEGVGTLDVEIV